MKYKILLFVFVLLPFFIKGQTIIGYHSENGTKSPELYWLSKNMTKPSDFRIFRSGMEKQEFKQIKTIHFTEARNDSLIFGVVDTSLIDEALYRYYIEVKLKDSTIIRSDILFGHNIKNIAPPQLISFYAEPAKDKKAINLNWKLNYNFTVKSLTLFRSKNYDNGYEVIANLPANSEKYTDVVDLSNEAYYYFIQINDFFGYQIPSIRIHGFSHFKEIPYPPQNFNVTRNKENIIELSWTNVGSNVIGNKIYRKVSVGESIKSGRGKFIPFTGLIQSGNEVSFADSILKTDETIQVSYYVVAVSDGYEESKPTNILTIYKQGDVEVSPPKEINYTIDSLQNIMLIWTHQDDDPNVKGYNIYKSFKNEKAKKLNSDLINYNKNFYVDESFSGVEDCTYEVESVSISDNVSNTKTYINVKQLYYLPHLILSLRKTDNGVNLEWKNPDWNNIKQIEFYRQKVNEKEVLITTVKSDSKNSYTDTSVKPGSFYVYSAVAVLKNNRKKSVNDGVGIKY